MISTTESTASIVNVAQLAAIAEALGLPDVSGISVRLLDGQDKATFAKALDEQIARVNEIVRLALAPVIAMRDEAKAAILHEIALAGGSMLPHDTFDVVANQKYERRKDIDKLRALEGKVPDDVLGEAVFVKAIEGTIAPEMVALAEQTPGAKVKWDADLRKCDVIARKYGGEIAQIIADASPKVEVGAPYLTITPRETALKAVSQ